MWMSEAATHPMPDQGWVLAGAILAGLLAFALYVPSLSSQFVYDARAQIEGDTYIHTPGHVWNILTLRVFSEDVVDAGRPVHLLSLWGDAMVWGKSPRGYHLTSNLLHAVTVALLFLLLLKLCAVERGADSRLAWCAALMGSLWFAVHPMHVEAVAEVSYREDLLAAALLLAGLNAATMFSVLRGTPRMVAAVFCVAFLLGAAGSKETGFAGPFLLTCYAALYHRNDGFRPWMPLLVVVFLVVGGLGAARLFLRPDVSEIFIVQPSHPGGSLSAALQIQPRIWTFLWGQMAWPHNLSADYMPSHIAGIAPAAGWTVLAFVVTVQIALSLKSRLACLGTTLFWLGLAPVSNFIPLFRPMADRFLYLPATGIACLLAAVVLMAARRRIVLIALTALWTICVPLLAWQTCQRQRVFANELNLWEDTVGTSPDSITALINRGYALYEAGDYGRAIADSERAVAMTRGQEPEPWAALALIFEKTGDLHQAEQALQQAMRLDPRFRTPLESFPPVMMDDLHAQTFEHIARRLRGGPSTER